MLLSCFVLGLAVLVATGPKGGYAECVNHPTDVIFLVDASTNDKAEFQKLLDFAVNITNNLDIGYYDYKIGMLIFSRMYRSIFYLNKYNDKNDVINAIQATDLHILGRNVTDTQDAIRYAHRTMARTSYGHRHGADLVFVVLVTNPSTAPSLTATNAKAMRDGTGGTVIAIGVGDNVPDSELAAIATDSAHITRVAGFDDLDSAGMTVLTEICPEDWFTGVPPTGAALTIDDCPASVPRNQYLQVFRGNCYQFNVFYLLSYSEAAQTCKRYNGTLVMIKNRETNFFIQNEMIYTYHVSYPAWIGLVEVAESTDNHKGIYEWADGENATYTNFGEVLNHDTEKNCIAIVSQLTSNDAGRWREYHCDPKDADLDESSRLRYICQYNVDVRPVAKVTTPGVPVVTTAAITDAPTDAPPTTPVSSTTVAPSPSTTTDIPDLGTNGTTAVTASVQPMGANVTTVANVTIAANVTMATTLADATVCPPFHCDLNCDLDGYKMDANKCAICECDF